MKTYLLLPLLFLGQLLIGQDVLLFDDRPEGTIVYRYSHLNGTSASAIRQMFQAVGAPPQGLASFDLSYAYQARILEETSQLKVCVNWQELVVSNAPSFGDFNFSTSFLPASVNYDLQLLADGEVVASEQVCQNLDHLPTSYTSTYGAVLGGVYYTLQLKNISFNYGTREVLLVQNRKKAIQQYLDAKVELELIRNRTTQLAATTPQPQELPALQQELQQIRLRLNRLGKAVFWQTLDLKTATAYDPAALLVMYTNCDTEISHLQNWLGEQQANIHILYYEQGISLYEQGRERAAYDAFCASLRANDCFAPSHYFVAYLDFAAGKVPDAAQRLQKVLNQYQPDPATREDAYQLARGIVRFYLDAGQNAVAQRDYPLAVTFYEDAMNFSQRIHGFQFGQAEAASRIQEAYTFDFQDRLDRVIGLHRQGHDVEALTHLDETLAFQQKFRVNSNYDTRGLAASIVNSIFNQQLAEIRQHRQSRQWEEGLVRIAETEKLLYDYPDLVNNMDDLKQEKDLLVKGKYADLYEAAEYSIRQQLLDKALQEAEVAARFAQQENLRIGRQSEAQIARVQRLRYQRFVKGGDDAKANGQYRIALEQYKQAQQLEQVLPYLNDSENLIEKVSLTAILAAEQIYTSALTEAATNNAALANSQQQIQRLAVEYGVAKHIRIQRLVNQLDDQQCLNARDRLLPAQERLLAQQQAKGDFIAARTHLNNIVALIDQYPSCGLSDFSIQSQGAIVQACANYQETLQTAQRAEEQRNYRQAIEKYVAAATAYQNPSVQARLAGHAAFQLFDYLSAHPDYQMTVAGGHYLLDQKQQEQALTLLNLVVQQGVDARYTEHLQVRLGTALAIRHYVDSADWKTTYYGFVDKDERKPYREMYKAFRKQWRRMA